MIICLLGICRVVLLFGEIKVVTKIRDEILCNSGIEADTKLQRRFCNRFRVSFSMFETMVIEECKDPTFLDASTQIGVFKLLGCLRILGRGAHCDDVAEILDCGKTTVNDVVKSFVNKYSTAYYVVHVYVPDRRGRNGSDYCGLY